MIYTIPMVIVSIYLAVCFREEFKDNTYGYLAMVCLGALIWPVTVIWMVSAWFEWRKG